LPGGALIGITNEILYGEKYVTGKFTKLPNETVEYPVGPNELKLVPFI
jgi:hypothetical protein